MKICGNNDNDKAMASIFQVVFKEGTPEDTFGREVMKHDDTEASVTNVCSNETGQTCS